MNEQLRADCGHLNSFESASVRSLVQIVMSFLLNPVASDFQSALAELAGTANISPGALKVSSKCLIVVLQGAMKEGWSGGQVHSECVKVGLSTAVVEDIVSCWQSKASDIASHLLSQSLSTNQLLDVDWSFGVTAATDDCDQVRVSPYLSRLYFLI